MSTGNGGHRYEIWWVDRANGPDVKRSGDSTFETQHEAVHEIVESEKPTSGHYVVKRFHLNSPAGEIVARPSPREA